MTSYSLLWGTQDPLFLILSIQRPFIFYIESSKTSYSLHWGIKGLWFPTLSSQRPMIFLFWAFWSLICGIKYLLLISYSEPSITFYSLHQAFKESRPLTPYSKAVALNDHLFATEPILSFPILILHDLWWGSCSLLWIFSKTFNPYSEAPRSPIPYLSLSNTFTLYTEPLSLIRNLQDLFYSPLWYIKDLLFPTVKPLFSVKRPLFHILSHQIIYWPFILDLRHQINLILYSEPSRPLIPFFLRLQRPSILYSEALKASYSSFWGLKDLPFLILNLQPPFIVYSEPSKTSYSLLWFLRHERLPFLPIWDLYRPL